MKLGRRWVVGIFLVVLLVFNRRLLTELFDRQNIQTVSDGAITEYITETAYQQIKAGHNPFERTYQVLYPLGVNFSLNDPGIGTLPYYAIFRQFVDVHRAMILVILTNIILTGYLMFIFLKELKISDETTGLATLVFTFTPFLSHRLLGHYTYVTMFVFPLVALLMTKVLDLKSKKQGWWTTALGVALAWTLYLNFYYFIMCALSVGIAIIYKWRWGNIKYWILTGLTTLVLLSPWVLGIIQYLKFENRTRAEGFGGAIFYSAQWQNFILPSAYNPIYKTIFKQVGGSVEQAFLHNWESMVYPGLLLLLTLLYWVIRRHKMPRKQRQQVSPWMWGGVMAAVLTLGPFLKWNGSIELLNLDGVAVVLPLPFLLLHYLPGLESLRVPGRFTPAMVFMLTVVGAYLLDNYLLKSKRKKLILGCLLVIFLFDQNYQIPPSVSPPIPSTLYEKIAQDRVESSVLEIPFTVRDGFRYAGFVHAISPMQGSLIHHKRVIGGYLARVSDETMNFYQNLKLTGYLLSITDRGNYDPVFEKPADPKLFPYPYPSTQTNEDLDFLGVKYILIKQDEPYTLLATQIMKEAGDSQIGSGQGYILYERKVGGFDNLAARYGDGTTEGTGYRAMVAQDTKLLLARSGGKAKIAITLSSEKPRTIEWYLNEKLGGEIMVSEKKAFDLGETTLKPGINILFLRIKNLEKGEALDKDSGVKIYSLKVDHS